MNEKNRNYEAFISYEETTGLEFAENLKKALKKGGISAFVAKRDLPVGRKFDEEIREVLDTCNIFIVILTANSSVSLYVKQEIDQALQRYEKGELKIIPYKYEGLNDDDIPTELKDFILVPFATKDYIANDLMEKLKVKHTHTTKIPKIEKDAKEAGIKRIFTNRRFDPAFEETIRKQIPETREILMMANSLRDFLGDKKVAKFNDLIIDAIEKGIKFKLLLLNPLSEAAKERAIIENGYIAENDEVYAVLPLYKDIQTVANWIYNNKSKTKDNIETRFSSLTPTVLMIKTDDYMFIEQYHIGSLKDAGIVIAKGDEHAYCLGGYVPILMVDNSSSFAKLMVSHFENAWDKAEKFDAMFDEIKEFSKSENQKNYRRKQVINYFRKKSSDLS